MFKWLSPFPINSHLSPVNCDDRPDINKQNDLRWQLKNNSFSFVVFFPQEINQHSETRWGIITIPYMFSNMWV